MKTMNRKVWTRWLLVVTCLLLVGMVAVPASATIYIYPEADGNTYRSTAGTFSQIRMGAGSGVGTLANSSIGTLISGSGADLFAELDRYGITFNLTPYAGYTFTSASLSLYGRGDGYAPKLNDFGGATINGTVTGAAPASNTTWAAGDYDNYDDTVLGTYPYADWTADQYNNASLDVSYFQARAGSYASVFLRNSRDVANASAWVASKTFTMRTYSDAATGTAKDPVLVLEGTTDDTTPPASITNLANVTTCNSVNITWDNPADADFNEIEYWLNGTRQLPNLTNTTTYKLFTGLAELTEYEFASRTCDLSGNCNATFVNQTAETGACGCGLICKIIRYFWQFRLPYWLVNT